jgi:ADP-heptose:LPS heptosyltransferase
VLVARICCLGDLLFVSPLLRALRQGLPGARIGLLTGSYSLPVAEGLRHLVDEVVELKAPWPPRDPLALARAAGSAWALRAGHWDSLLITHRSLGVRALMALSGAGRRVGLSWKGDARLLHDAAQYNPETHEVDRFLDLLLPLGVGPRGRELEWRLPEAWRPLADGLIPPGDKPLAALLPGGGSNPGMRLAHKRWTPEGFRAVAERLAVTHRLIALGSAEDFDACEAALGGLGANLAGRSDLPSLASLLSRAALVVGNDSGPLHLAEAMGVKSLGIYGPTSARHYGPLSGNCLAVEGAAACRPCYTPAGGLSPEGAACGDNVCMRRLAPEAVLGALEAGNAR